MREKRTLNDLWYFSETFEIDMLEDNYDFSFMEKVRIPHTFVVTPFNSFDESLYQKDAIYLRDIYGESTWKNKNVFFECMGAGHKTEVYVNGMLVYTHNCGYTSFKIDISEYLILGKKNRIILRVNSQENLNIPPFGNVIDYMTYGGIYREVYLEICHKCHLEEIYIATDNDLGQTKQINIEGSIAEKITEDKVLMFQCELSEYYSGNIVRKFEKRKIKNNKFVFREEIENIELWSTNNPFLYVMNLCLYDNEKLIDNKKIRFGFRKAEFKMDGFYLNGIKTKIIGINRHQSYPYIGYAAPKSIQRFDAEIIKNELGLNAVRTSHYPQSIHFINRCDELGILVFTEIPGWQHIGDALWKDIALQNVKEMIIQYRNNPSIILWGVRINESKDDFEFYKDTNNLAHKLDKYRQTGGVRCIKQSELLEDVYTYNDFSHEGWNRGVLKKSKVTSDISKGYLVSEYNGHMYPTKSYDDESHRLNQTLRHGKVLDGIMGEDDIAGGFAWCMSDYNTHKDFGSGDRVCYHGILDMFRNHKMAAAIYKVNNEENPVLELSTDMNMGEHPAAVLGKVYAFTNADSIKLYKNNQLINEFQTINKEFPNLKHPPVLINDFIGNQLEKNEGMDYKTSKQVKNILINTAVFGLRKISLKTKLSAAKLMLKNDMSFEKIENLYQKYIGNWGSNVTTYKFEAIKNGKVMKTLIKDSNVERYLDVSVSSKILVEDETYDMALIRIRIVDINGNIQTYCNEAIRLKVSGDIKLVGPEYIPIMGGMAGTFVRSKNVMKNSEGRLEIVTSNGITETINFEINCWNGGK